MKPLLPFFAGLGFVLLAAWVAPGVGAKGGPLHTEKTTGYAVMIIFLIQGLQLPAGQVRKGFAAWPVHLFCQSSMFVLYPLLGWLMATIYGPWLDPGQRIGLLFLAILPTTVATNAAFSAQAGGNTATCLFNIVVGNLAGVFIAPLWLAWLLVRGAGASVDVWPLVLSIVTQLIIPFAVGQFFRQWLADWVGRNRRLLREVNFWMIFFIVYAAVCNSLSRPTGPGGGGLLPVMAATLSLLIVGKITIWLLLGRFHWAHDLKVAAFYASSQKTLAAGLPIATAVYAATTGNGHLPPLAVLALPLIIFHIGQLLIGALLIPVVARSGHHATA